MAIKVLIDSDITFSLTSNDYNMRAMARASDGRIWIAHRIASTTQILVKYSDDGGKTWTSEEAVAAATRNRYSVVLMIDSDDVPHIIYSFDAVNDEIRYVNRSGGSWSAPETVHTAVGALSIIRACIDQNNDIHVIFREVIAGEDLHYYQRLNGTWQSREVVDADGFPHDIVADSGDRVYAVFNDAVDGLYYLRIRQTDGTWDARETISANNTSLLTRDAASIAIDGDDDLHVAFIEEGYAPDIGYKQVRYRKREGGTWQTNLQVEVPAEGEDMFEPILILDTDDDAYVVYQQGTSAPNENVYCRKVTGETVEAQVLVASILRPGNHSSLYAGLWQRYNTKPILGSLSSSVVPSDYQPVVALIQEDTATTYSLHFYALDYIPQVRFYQMYVKGLCLPYMDLDGTKELHVVLKNLSPTSKEVGVDGEVVVEVGYSPEA